MTVPDHVRQREREHAAHTVNAPRDDIDEPSDAELAAIEAEDGAE